MQLLCRGLIAIIIDTITHGCETLLNWIDTFTRCTYYDVINATCMRDFTTACSEDILSQE